MEFNNVIRMSAPKCKGCGSDAGFVAVKAERVDSLVVISYGCKHCDCGQLVHCTYQYDDSGVRVTEGYPADYAKAQKVPLQVRPLLFSQVEAIKNGMNWPVSPYLPLPSTHRSKNWAIEFGKKLQSTKAEEVPGKTVRVNIAKQGTGLILRENVEMKFEINKLIVDTAVTVAEMATEALERSGLLAEGFGWCRVVQRKELADSIEFVEANVNSPIQHGAHYKVVVVRKQQ